MSNVSDDSSGFDFRLPTELKQVIERAAALRGQSLDDFAVSTLIENAQRVIHEHQVTALSDHDRDIFLAMLDDEDSAPSNALLASADRYKEWLRRREP